MLHSPLFFVWTGNYTACVGWTVVIGVIAVVRWICARQEEAEREQRRAERASRRVGPLRAAHPISLPQRHSLPPDYRQHLIDAGAGSGIIEPAGDPA